MKQLKFITCCPDDTYYTWQVQLWLESLKRINQSEKAVVLLFLPSGRKPNRKWDRIRELYPEVEFNLYHDDNNDISSAYIPVYIPILRPYVMWRWMKENPEAKNWALFYCDSDILFTQKFNIDEFVNDNINYVSNTNSYISVDYFDSKIKDVKESRKDEYSQMDVFSMLGSLIGITREQGLENRYDSGGAQYILKNVDAEFWKKVMKDCIIIRRYLQTINDEFFENESRGFQSWCADMWAVLWNLWLIEGSKTKVIPEMDFAWATDPIEKLNTAPIMHNAGIVGEWVNLTPTKGYNAFYKGKYHQGADPTKDSHLKKVLEDPVAKGYCTYYYALKLDELKNKYNINY